MNQPYKYLSLRASKARKIGQRSQGFIHYQILTDDQTHQKLYIFITSNDDDGYYSKEIVPFEKIELCLKDIKPNSPISSKLFKSAFIGQSNNNHAFLAAILRAEGLIAPVTDAVRKHTLQPDWDSWKTEMLKNAAKAKPFEPELAKPIKEVGLKKKIVKSPTADSDISELDDAEMALLLQHSVPDVEDKEPAKKRSKKPS